MKKMSAAIGVSMAVCLATLVVAQEDTIVLDSCGDKRASVTFGHAAHASVAGCQDCHHTNEGLTAGSSQKVEKCVACHLTPESPETPSCSEMGLKNNAYHIDCIGCHKKEAKGPTKCNDCHPKE